MANELPDQINDWPNDPFALLGVKRGDDELTIRRAYTKLIRQYKPEQFPEQFAKIRSAYESCKSQWQWYRPTETETAKPADTSESTERTKPIDTREPLEKSTIFEETIIDPPVIVFNREGETNHSEPDNPNVNVRDPLAIQIPEPIQNPDDLLWAKAVEGNLADAYAGLVQRSKAEGDDVDRSLRLYWLLTFDATLDKTRSRHVWLHNALTQSRFDERCVELYRRELLTDPKACLDDPYNGLLDIDASWNQLLNVCRLRIMAAAKLKRLSQVKFDLKRIAKKKTMDHDLDWLYLLVYTHDWIGWEDSILFRSYFEEELATVRSFELQHGDSFDRIDLTRHLTAQNRVDDHGNLAPFIRLIQSLWANHSHVSRTELIAGLQTIAESPRRSIRWFDDYISQCGFDYAVIMLQLLSQFTGSWDNPISPDQIRAYIHRAVNKGFTSRKMIRYELLEMLIQDGIGPSEVIAACVSDQHEFVRDIANILKGDFSVQIVWMATMICPFAATFKTQRQAG